LTKKAATGCSLRLRPAVATVRRGAAEWTVAGSEETMSCPAPKIKTIAPSTAESSSRNALAARFRDAA
jgi:hypothetical protein